MRIDESRTAVKYTPGRQGRKIVDLVIHHWGLDGQTHDGVVDWFCNPAKGAQTSAHFVVSAGRVHCIVSPADTAWHAGYWDENLQSIGIECRPEATAADYATVAELVRWLRTRYGNLPLRPHKQFYSTDCPGRWDLSRLDRLAREQTGGGDVSGAMRPVPGMYPVTQRFSDNATIYNYGAGHGAIDYGVPVGTPILAPEDGVVGHADWAWNLPGGPNDWAARDYQIKPAPGDTRTGGGIMVSITNSAGSRWWLCHLSKTDLNRGDRVRQGQIIGYSGNTGSSTGPHLHVSLLPATPNWGNGFFGAIDPAPYITVAYLPLTYTTWQGTATAGAGATTINIDPLGGLLDMDQKTFNAQKKIAGTPAWYLANGRDHSANLTAAVKGLTALVKGIPASVLKAEVIRKGAGKGSTVTQAEALAYDKDNWDRDRAAQQKIIEQQAQIIALLTEKKGS